MVTYVSLINWTDQGVRSYQDTVKRAEDFRALVDRQGGRVREVLWTLGEHDLVSVAEFPDEQTATATMLQITSLGNVRSRTLRAFDAEEMQGIVDRSTS